MSLVLPVFFALLFGSLPIVGLLMIVKSVGNMKDPDKWWNPLRVAPLEGEIEFYMISSATGPLGTIAISIAGWYLSLAGIITKEIEDPTKPPREMTELDELNDFLRKKFGLVWVGFFRKRQKFKRRYNKYGKDEGKNTDGTQSTKYTIVPREEEAHSLYFQTVIGIEAIGAETTENFPVNAIVGGTVRIVNPSLAQYFAGDLYTQVTIAVQGVMRSFIGRHSYTQLREMKSKNGVILLVEEIRALNDELIKNFGVEIINASFIEFDIQDGSKEAQAATQAEEIARMRAKAVQATAEGEAKAERIRAEGIAAAEVTKAKGTAEAQNILTDAEKRRVAEVYSTISSIPRGAEIRHSEAVEKTNLRAYARGGPPGMGFQIITDDVSE